MNNILIHRDQASLKLTFIDAFHPSAISIKAEQWFSRYKLGFSDNDFEFQDFFSGNFWYLDGDDLIVLEMYSNEDFDDESIRYVDDIELQLFLIDFKRNAFAKFSHLQGGKFEVLSLTENNRIIYQKWKNGIIKEFEVGINDLKFEYAF